MIVTRDESTDLKNELADLHEKHQDLVVENRALVDEMGRKEKIWRDETAARLDADAEARLKENELEEQEETLLALRNELAASAVDNTALEEKVEQLETNEKTLETTDHEVEKVLATSQINMVCNRMSQIDFEMVECGCRQTSRKQTTNFPKYKIICLTSSNIAGAVPCHID